MTEIYVLELVTAQGKLMAPEVYFQSKEEIYAFIKSRSKFINGYPTFRTFVRDGWTIVDYGSHSLSYRFKKIVVCF